MTANLPGASPEPETESRSRPPLPAARSRFATKRHDGTVRSGPGSPSGQSAAATPE